MTDRIFNAWINPLQFLEVDEPWASGMDSKPTLESVVRFATAPSTDADLATLLGRYKEISKEPVRLFAAPAEDRILEKLVWPLRHAKAAYMFGNFIGTIAMCGMVAEMVTILLFDLAEIRISGTLLNRKSEMALFGRQFEKLGQERRVSILHTYGIIDDRLQEVLDLSREKRRRYLHLWSQDHSSLPDDARGTFHAAVFLAASAIGQELQDGKVVLTPSLVKYLDGHGLLKSPEAPDAK